MDAPTSDRKPTSQEDAIFSELLTEFTVDMKCEGCVNSMKNKLQTVNGLFFWGVERVVGYIIGRILIKQPYINGAVSEELIDDILLRLPVKSLVGFKTVSKKWYSLISEDVEFAKLHLKQSSLAPSKIHSFFNQIWAPDITLDYIFQSSDVDDHHERIRFLKNDIMELWEKRVAKRSITGLEIKPYGYSLQIKFPTETMRNGALGSINGLICVVSWSACGLCVRCFLWNPSTGDSKNISSSALLTSGYILEGFGYDLYSDDYKIVGIQNDSFALGIFSLKDNSWKMHQNEFYHLYGKPTFFNGAFHWCFDAKIVGFDLAKEEFFEMEISEEARPIYGCELFIWLDSLCLNDKGTLWVMKEYGIAKSWAELEPPGGFPREKIIFNFTSHKESSMSPKYVLKDELEY